MSYRVKLSQTKTNIIWYHLYVESRKMVQMNIFTKQKYKSQSVENKLTVTRAGHKRVEDKLGDWD